MHQDVVKGQLDDNVEKVNLCHGQTVYEHGSKGVEKDLEGCEKGLASDRVKKDGFKGGGQIGVKAIDSQRFVVDEVVRPKRGAVGNADWQICKDSKESVCQGRSEGQVVRYLVDGEEEVLVGCGTNRVGGEQEGP